MAVIRPEALAVLARWREMAGAGALLAVALWLVARGGWLFGPFGAGLAVLAAGWGVVALRRMRFAQAIAAPGIVEVIEGQIGYFAPQMGGILSLADLSEIRLTRMGEAAAWRLKQTDGQMLTIPVGAEGAEALFDAFAALPGIDMGRLSAALGANSRDWPERLWSRAVPALADPNHKAPPQGPAA